MKKRRPIENTPVEPPMTAMIDIIFQLLVFFMLTMKFVVQEGELLSHLPRGHVGGDGLMLDEVRIYLCAGGDIRRHREDKGAHEAAPQDPHTIELFVEGEFIGSLPRTEDDPAAAGPNQDAYRRAADRAAQIVRILPPDALLKLDADSGVPYEHVLGTLNAVHRLRLDRPIEFAANPKLAGLVGR